MAVPAKNHIEGEDNSLSFFESILKRAMEKKASDLHLKVGLPPIVRVNGNLYYLGDDAGKTILRLSSDLLNRIVHSLMKPHQIEKYNAGEEIDMGYEISGAGRFRINLCHQRSAPRLVCRYIPDQIRTMEDLKLPPVVQELTLAQRGLILVTGATGSGKSTSLAAMIDHIARNQSCHIVTIEDPIEFTFKDRKSIVTQREVGLDTRSFARALKYALRQDPDVILVGEMRDEETIMMVLAAAETGHLVLSTLHTVDASETVNRILGSISTGMQGQARAQLASVLVGVVSQRLLRSVDGKSRIPAVEVLLSNARIKELITDPLRTADLTRVIEESHNEGMQTFDQSLMKLVQAGQITKEEALNNCTNVRDFQLRLEGVVSGEWMQEDNRVISRKEQVRRILEEGTPESVEVEIESDDPEPSVKTVQVNSRRE